MLNNYEVFIKTKAGLQSFSVWGTKLSVDNNIVKIFDGKEEIFVSLLHPGISVRLAEQMKSVQVVKTRKKTI